MNPRLVILCGGMMLSKVLSVEQGFCSAFDAHQVIIWLDEILQVERIVCGSLNVWGAKCRNTERSRSWGGALRIWHGFRVLSAPRSSKNIQVTDGSKQEDRVVVAQLDRACACGVDRTANAANFNPMNGGACLRPDRHLSSMGTCSPCRTVNKAVTDFRNPCLLAAIANHAHRQDNGWGGGRFLGI
ncbi:hypothetical protein [Rhodoferax sp.]|uniref:hypothetical protein n=1 Tax=Rhodoferax sp. TaxID=50421 RepID=UPI00272BA6FD|nr:hypothetical protein [Rhodoferax sp.]